MSDDTACQTSVNCSSDVFIASASSRLSASLTFADNAGGGSPDVMLVGDSHSDSLYSGLAAAYAIGWVTAGVLQPERSAARLTVRRCEGCAVAELRQPTI